jgi:tRNA(Ile)-lysidine synthetase-like protein
VDCARLPPTLAIEFRRGGERVPGAAGHRDVKSLLREAGIPEWQRAQVPFICAPAAPEAGQMARLLAIGDLWVAPELLPQDLDAERGRFIWQPQ